MIKTILETTTPQTIIVIASATACVIAGGFFVGRLIRLSLDKRKDNKQLRKDVKELNRRLYTIEENVNIETEEQKAERERKENVDKIVNTLGGILDVFKGE